jgi:hypothetical protein
MLHLVLVDMKVEMAGPTGDAIVTCEENPRSPLCSSERTADVPRARTMTYSAFSGAALGGRRTQEFLDIFATVLVFVPKKLIGYLS